MVIATSRTPGAATMRPISAGRPGRTSGSPPVTRISLTPSPANRFTSRISSSSVSSSSRGSHFIPSAGMQYRQRRLQRSVTESRSERWVRPKPSPSRSGALIAPS